MKALKVEMVDIQPMSSKEAYEKGYPVFVTWAKFGLKRNNYEVQKES